MYIKTKLMLKCNDELWKKVQLYKIQNDYTTLNDAVIALIEKGLE